MSLIAAIRLLGAVGKLPRRVVDRLLNNDLTRERMRLDNQAKQIENFHNFIRMVRDAKKVLPEAGERRRITRLFLNSDLKPKN